MSLTPGLCPLTARALLLTDPEELAVLDMRPACERCGSALPQDGDARICSYECTFCPACSEEMSSRCPNCGGELLPRPRRTAAGPSAG
jgi:uncharacterized protein